jgi:predicted small lipoprotein YifL
MNWKMIAAVIVTAFALAACGDKDSDTGAEHHNNAGDTHEVAR